MSLQVKIGWMSLVLLILGCLVAPAVVLIEPGRPVIETQVTVTGTFGKPGRWGSTETVTFRTEDGLVGQDTLLANVVGCKVGDVVPARRRGVTVGLGTQACRKQAP